MALKLKYTDEHGILHINMSPLSTPTNPNSQNDETDKQTDITDPKFDTINNRFGQYDLFGGKYGVDSGGETEGTEKQSLFRSRYNSIEEELANTPYAFATERTLRLNANSPVLDITIARSKATDVSPSKDIEDDRFFNRTYDLFGPKIDFTTSIKTSDEEDSLNINNTPAFTVTQLIHAQDRYFDLSSRHGVKVDHPKTDSVKVKSLRSAPSSGVKRTVNIVTSDEAFKVLGDEGDGVKSKRKEGVQLPVPPSVSTPSKQKKKESSFAILAEAPVSRPSSPRSLPLETRSGRVSPFKGRGFRREETSRHTTPKTSAANSRSNSRVNSQANSRANSPPRRRTNSLSKLDKMATATLPPPIPPIHSLSRPHSPRNFVKENIEEVRELSELNREKHEAEAEKKRKEEEEALLKEMAEFEGKTTEAIRSVVCSRATSRSNSPNKLKLRSRSNSPAALASPAVLHYENISSGSSEYINTDDGMSYPVTHNSRLRFVSKSQPQSNDGSPKHSKIPTRQNSVSPTRSKRDSSNSRRVENNLNRSQRFISNSTSSINESAKFGNQVQAKKGMSKSTQQLHISPAHVKGKPPIPGKVGPPPSNKAINSKRLSPIVGTPSKTPTDESKPNSARTPTKTTPVAKKPIKTAGNTPATSRFSSRQPSRTVSRDPSPDKRKAIGRNAITSKTTTNTTTRSKPVARSVSTRVPQKPSTISKTEVSKPINRTNSMKTLSRTPSVKTLNEKPPLLKKKDSTRDLSLRATSSTKINDVGTKKESGAAAKKDEGKSPKKVEKSKDVSEKSSKNEKENKKATEKSEKSSKTTTETGTMSNGGESVMKQDNETQYDTITNDKGELVILTKKNIVSMTTAAITSQPLEVVTKVTNQLPVVLEKAREKALFERLSSKESLVPKDEMKPENVSEPSEKESSKTEVTKEDSKNKNSNEVKSDSKAEPAKNETEKESKDTNKDKTEEEKDDKKVTKPPRNPVFTDDNVKLKPLLPPYNNPQVARVKQKIDEILNSPEVSTENIFATVNEATKPKEIKSTFKSVADKTKSDIKDVKDDAAAKIMDIKDEAIKAEKAAEKAVQKHAEDIRKEVTKIFDNTITPVEEPKDKLKAPEETKKTIEPIIMVVNEKKNTQMEIVEKMTETLVKGEPEVEVQSSNMSTPKVDRMEVQNKMAEGSESDKSQSNGGFPQSTSTTPKPPARTKRDQSKDLQSSNASKENTPDPQKRPNICLRLMEKCKKCCPCCTKAAEDEEKEMEDVEKAEKRGMMSRLNCCKRNKDGENEVERVVGKTQDTSIQYETETKRKRKLRDVFCACCARRRRVSDASMMRGRSLSPDASEPSVVTKSGCCGTKKAEVERRDSILSDPPANTCCNNRLFNWMRGKCGRQQPEQLSASRRQSLFSKNKSLSPTLPPEDTRTKLDPSLIEHTSVMRGAIPVLPVSLAWLCLACNVIVPGLGTILSGMFCLCFGIPRFGVHDGVKHRIGSFVINLLVGCGQLFTVLFCLVGWGWSIWWGVIMLKTARKYRRLKAEEASQDAESAAPPVTANNHTRA